MSGIATAFATDDRIASHAEVKASPAALMDGPPKNGLTAAEALKVPPHADMPASTLPNKMLAGDRKFY